jgi:uncharacterized integral membrane protein
MVEGIGGPERVPPTGGLAPTAGSPAPPGPPGSTPPGSVPSGPTARRTPAPTATTGAALRHTRFSGAWVGVTVAAVSLILLLTFILQNNGLVQIAFFGAHGRLPLGVALLLAAAGGVVLVAVPGYGRIIQLRRAVKRSGTTTPVPPTGKERDIT